MTNKKLKSNFLFAFCFVVLIFAFCFLNSVNAINMESSRYRIQFGNIGIGGDNLTSDDIRLTTSLGQLAANRFDSDGYVVKAGFQYIHSIIPFRFSISKTNIDFGSLIPNKPSEVASILSVSFGGAGQYQVTAVEEGPLQTMAGTFIPDTLCNGGKNTCDETTPKLWDLNNTYGFGYTMDVGGKDIPESFVNCYQTSGNKSCYRPFPDSLQPTPETPAIVMFSPNVGRNKQATIKFKVNIGPSQTTGSYQTIISFVATPTY